MADSQMPPARGQRNVGPHGEDGAPSAEETLDALLHDLRELEGYLTQRGRHTYELAQRFLDSARRNEASRAFDERQATMLEYQHYIWHEIAGLVNKLLVAYGDAEASEPDAGASDSDGKN